MLKIVDIFSLFGVIMNKDAKNTFVHFFLNGHIFC